MSRSPLQTIRDRLSLLRIDPFTIALVATVVLASLAPVTSTIAANALDKAVDIAVFMLFFIHGARISREAVIQGLTHWRLHLVVLASTFVLFPVLGILLKPIATLMLAPALYLGLLYLCCLPSTVQSSIAFTSIAHGNVPAAICSASASNLLGIFITPLLTALLLGAHNSSVSLDSIGAIATQLLLPFILGQILRKWIGDWVTRQKVLLTFVDRGAILLMVYAAFSKAVITGIWHQISAVQLLALTVICCILLALVIFLTGFFGRRLGFPRADVITIVFCGSKKSLITGVPMANVLFPGAQAGVVVLPLMLFHQIQLIVCAILARRYAEQSDT